MPKRIFDRWREYLEEGDILDFDFYVERIPAPGSVFEQMLRIAGEQHALLTHHQRDLLVHDRRVLEDAKPDDQFVWLLRDMGTEIAEVGDPLQGITYWIPRRTPANLPANATRVFLLTVTHTDGEGYSIAYGTVEPITYTQAYELLV